MVMNLLLHLLILSYKLLNLFLYLQKYVLTWLFVYNRFSAFMIICCPISHFFTTSVSLGKGRGQHAAIRLKKVMVTPNGPIRAKQVNQSSSVIG